MSFGLGKRSLDACGLLLGPEGSACKSLILKEKQKVLAAIAKDREEKVKGSFSVHHQPQSPRTILRTRIHGVLVASGYRGKEKSLDENRIKVKVERCPYQEYQ